MRILQHVTAIVFCAALHGQRTTWIVDPSGAGNFGDLVTNKPLVILGETNYSSRVLSITFQDLLAGTETIVDHVEVEWFGTRSALVFRRCAGRVVVDNVRQRVYGQVFNYFYPVAEITNCRDVSMTRCDSGGNQGAIVTDSSLTLDRCDFEPGPAHIPSDYGVSGLDVVRSRVWIQASICAGNAGRIAGGYGIRALDSEVRIGSGSSLNGGGGFSRSLELNWSRVSTAPDVSTAFVSLQSSSLVTVFLPTVLATGSLGGAATATMRSDAGGIVLLALGESRAPLQVGRPGELGLDLSSVTTVLGVGGPLLSLSVAVPNDPRLFGATFGAQGGHLDANGDFWLSNRAPLVLL